MSTIVPAILPASLEDLQGKLSQIEGLCDEVQIDAVDGKFAEPACWPYNEDPNAPSKMLEEGRMLPGTGTFKVEVDLMSQDPEKDVGAWIALGTTRLTIHAESTRYLKRFLDTTTTMYGHDKEFSADLLSLGFAIGVETDLALIEPYLDRINYVQFMGIKSIGKQGQVFDPRTVNNVRVFHRRYPDMPIQVDGGVTLANAPQLLDAGVSRLIVGSGLWRTPDPKETYASFLAITEQYGLYG